MKKKGYQFCKQVLYLQVDIENIEIIGIIINKIIVIMLNGYIILNIKYDDIFVKIKIILIINIRIYFFIFFILLLGNNGENFS